MKDGDEQGCLCHHLTAGLTAKNMWTSSASTSNICPAVFLNCDGKSELPAHI